MILRRMFRRKPGSRKGFLCNRSGMAAVEFALMGDHDRAPLGIDAQLHL